MSRTTIRDLERSYEDGEALTMLTAYDAEVARLVEGGGVDVILVGDSAAHNHLGYEDTLPITLAEAVSNTAAVVRGTEEAMVVADLPFGSYGRSIAESVENASRFLKEAGADAVKFETAPDGGITVEIACRCTELGIPVQGHLGLTPQRMNQIGGPVIQGRGRSGVCLCGPPGRHGERTGRRRCLLARTGRGNRGGRPPGHRVGRRPPIGIGAGRYTDGQVLVVTDLLGLNPSGYRLSKQYADLDATIEGAVGQFVEEVRGGEFPAEENVYEPVDQ